MNDANNEQDIEAIKLRVAHQNISILIDRAEAAEKRVTELEAELREAGSPRQPSADSREKCDRAEVIVSRAENCWITVHDREQLVRNIRLALDTEVEAGGPYLLREISQHPVPAPETQIQDDNAELVRMAEKLLEWMPIYSKGSSGNIRQTNLRAAIEKFKVEHPEPAPEQCLRTWGNRQCQKVGKHIGPHEFEEHPESAKGGGE